ncbi:MAG: arginine--tRNA ligase, partial [Treponema sp.]|nr:arginine--tRNA ligase [Treponema sp.]
MNLKDSWKNNIAQALNIFAQEAGIEADIKPDALVAEIPPNAEMGDLGFPMFGFAKQFRKGPPQIASAIAEKLSSNLELEKIGKAIAAGPYVNVFLNRGEAATQILADVFDDKKQYGRPGTLDNNKIMVEFSSPNTNKPLHLGHLRNDVLGESMSR